MSSSVISTRVTKLLGITHPIILPGMSWISKPQLVAAVSEAGGLGILATGPLTADETRESIREIRRLTNKPFGIGATLLMPGATENCNVALEEQVPVINFSLGKGDWIVKRCHEYGGKVIATVVNEKHAKSAEDMGADILMVTGHEAAAHGGEVTSIVLIPSISDKVKIPLICAGGIADGRGLLAALSLGADAVAMGSRLATTKESPLHENIKEAIVVNSENDTVYGKNFDGLFARVMKTPTSELAMKKKVDPITAGIKAFSAAQQFEIPLWKVLPGLITQWNKMYMLSLFGAATEKLMKATIDGDLKNGVQFIGQSQGLINDIPSVHELIDRCIQEATVAHHKIEKKITIKETVHSL